MIKSQPIGIALIGALMYHDGQWPFIAGMLVGAAFAMLVVDISDYFEL